MTGRAVSGLVMGASLRGQPGEGRYGRRSARSGCSSATAFEGCRTFP